ncbi:uncharacterized protein N7483_007774 [Penicillium malachiteum]|uniref:uncharacterized protein n=1 Tax=Penicillium malachiteum TaxID=1324776 RepID=UPI0025497B09|nr:uncharacterized protein N7483_007774 [Penicillium malachiteum]KAJ5726417.1 hypothetical protein N7483_007774 [Penicillium malachiteum]
MPVSHLTLTVSHLPTSTSFFLSCLQPLGYQFIGRHDDYIGFGQKQGEPADFWVTERKPGGSASAVHVAFPAPTRDAVHTFFISALKAGGTMQSEPKCRDSQLGLFSAAVVDFDGNSIEAVYRSGGTVVASEAGGPTIALLENGSVVSKSSRASTVISKATSVTRVSSVRTESIAPPRSEAKSRAISRAPTTVERAAPSMVSRAPPAPVAAPAPAPTYTVVQNIQAPDDGSKIAKTIVGTLIGAAAGAAIAYAMVKGDSQSSSDGATNNPPPQYTTPQYVPEHHQLMGPPSQVSRQSEGQHQEYQGYQQYRALEAPPPRSVYTSASGPRSVMSRSVSSKNPRASTIYEGTEYVDEHGRRASDGMSILEDVPLRAIEYPPSMNGWRDHCNPSTFISSYAADKPRSGSVISSSTIKASQAGNNTRRYSHDDRDTYSTHSQSNSNAIYRPAPSQASHVSSKSTKEKDDSRSIASSTRSARNIPLPAGTSASYYSAAPSAHGKSYLSAREVPLPESVIDLDVRSNVTPDDSISQIGSRSGRSTHSHASKHSKTSRHTSRSKYDEPVKPADSVSQVSRASQHTVKAGSGSKAPSKVGSRRGSEVVV